MPGSPGLGARGASARIDERDPAADGIPVAEDPADELLVHHDHVLIRLEVHGVEAAPGHDGHPQGAEERLIDRGDLRRVTSGRRRWSARALDFEPSLGVDVPRKLSGPGNRANGGLPRSGNRQAGAAAREPRASAVRISPTMAVLSPTEAAFVAELPRKTVEQAIDRGEVKPLRAERGERERALDEAAVIYLRIRGDIGDLLTAKAREEVYRALRREEPVRSRLELGPIAVSTTEAMRTVRERMGRLRRARAAVEIDPEIRGGEPVVRGTRIPVYMLADLAKAGEPRDRILEDYPALDAELLEDALLYASLNPRRGRPRTTPWRERKPRRDFSADKLRGE